MDGGIYGRSAAFRQGSSTQSPLTPNAPPAGGQYKANVNRTKTRKWVEAKVQNYDGDDWGADEYDDDDEPQEEPPAPAPPAPKQQLPHQQQISAARLNRNEPSFAPSFLPSARPSHYDAPPAASTRGKAPVDQPPLHIQTPGPATASSRPTVPFPAGPERVPSPASASQIPQSAATVSSVYSTSTQPRVTSPASDAPAPSRYPPRKSSMSLQEHPELGGFIPPSISSGPAASASLTQPTPPAQASESSTKPPSFVRPSDIYRRMGGDKERERLSMESGRPSMDSITRAQPSGSGDPPSRQNVNEVPGSTLAERKDERGPDASETGTLGTIGGIPGQAFGPAQTSSGVHTHNSGEDDMRRFSTSPKLPDLARMSGFGADFFTTPTGFSQAPASLPTIADEADLSESQLLSRPPESRPDSTTPTATRAPDASALGITPIAKSVDEAAKSEDITSKTELQAGNKMATLLPVRPSIPGGWITETPSIPGEVDDTKSIATPQLEDTPRQVQQPTASSTASEAGEGQSAEEEDDKAPSTTSDHVVAGSSSRSTPGEHNTEPNIAASEIQPTAPLIPRRSEDLPPERLDFRRPEAERMSTIDTTQSSPVKESDMLREEIIRTLSPVKSSGDASFQSVETPKGGLAGVRESSYLADVYDDYWGSEDRPDTATTSDKAHPAGGVMSKQHDGPDVTAHPAVQETDPGQAAAAAPQPLSPRTDQRGGSAPPPPQTLRPRFSWEMAFDGPTSAARTGQKQMPVEPASEDLTTSSTGPPPHTTATNAGQPGLAASPIEHSAPPVPDDDKEVVTAGPSAPGDMSHQVSQASTLPVREALPQSPSPLSDVIEQPAAEARRMSLAEENALAQSSSSPVVPSPPREQHPALADLSQSHSIPAEETKPLPPTATILTFKQCMSMNSVEERIQRLQETRYHFSVADSGLAEWLSHMCGQAEHANATGSLRDDLKANQPVGSGQTAGAAAQQPYYQQYLNASSSNLPAPPPPGRQSATAHLTSQFGSSNFSHSGAQVGAKSKELLRTAGKAGKGLFSKGKSKLRGTGEKVFS